MTTQTLHVCHICQYMPSQTDPPVTHHPWPFLGSAGSSRHVVSSVHLQPGRCRGLDFANLAEAWLRGDEAPNALRRVVLAYSTGRRLGCFVNGQTWTLVSFDLDELDVYWNTGARTPKFSFFRMISVLLTRCLWLCTTL